MATPSTEFAEPEQSPTQWLQRVATWPRWEFVAVAAVTYAALILRLHGISAAPAFTDNLDEIQFTWAGLNMILHGDAITWSFYPGYPVYENVAAFGVNVPVVHHWMDHPPLFSLLMGGWVWLLGVRTMTGFDASQVRLVPVVFSTLTIPLVHLLGRRFVGAWPALIGAALLATAPAAVLFGREAEPEAVQAVLLLVALLLTVRVLDGKAGRWTVGGLLVIALLAPLLKVSGIAIGGICAVILVTGGQWRLAAAAVGAAALSVLGFVAYGALIDWQLFVRIWGVQAGNRIGMLSGIDFLAAFAGINRTVHDGWWLLGWLGLGLLVAVRRGARLVGSRRVPASEDEAAVRRWDRTELLLAWPVAAYLATMLVLAGERQAEQYGWYRVIVYPLVYLAAGHLAWEAITRRSLVLLTLLLVLGGTTATNWWLGGPNAGWVPNPIVLVVLFGAALVPAALTMWRPNPTWERIGTAVAAAMVAFMLLGNTIESLRLETFFWRN